MSGFTKRRIALAIITTVFLPFIAIGIIAASFVVGYNIGMSWLDDLGEYVNRIGND